MKVALISPKGPLYRNRAGIFRKSLRYQPLTLTTLAALAPSELDIEFVLYDEASADAPGAIDADLVGMTVITGTALRAYELATRYRAQGKRVVLGGPHVTLLPEEAMMNADAICTGYAEETWPQLLRDFAADRMERRYSQAPGFELTNLPFARRDLLDSRNYLTQAVFEATRACAHDCEFCVAPTAWGRKQLQKPVEHVVEDVRRVGAKKILFIDLNLISDRAYARALFMSLVPLKVRWFGLSTSLIGRDIELMDLMAQSGCTGLLIGFETVSPAGLGAIRKKFNDPDAYAATIRELHKHGISIQGCFVFGGDEDTVETFDRAVQFILETKIDLPRFAIVTPFPGTPLHARLAREGRILTRDWSFYDGQHVVFRPKGMSVAELQRGHEQAWRKVYSYRAIFSRVAQARMQVPLSLAVNLGYRYYARRLHTHYNCDWLEMQSEAA